MSTRKKWIGDLYISPAWYLAVLGIVLLFFTSYFVHFLFQPAVMAATMLGISTVADYVLLFVLQGALTGHRDMAARFSIGEENPVTAVLHNDYRFRVRGRLIDELPIQFQKRDFAARFTISYRAPSSVHYNLRPLSRGEYAFGNLLAYAQSPLGLLRRRFVVAGPQAIKVYPSFRHLRQFQLLAVSGTSVTGVRKVRRLGHSLEFEKIKEYVPGDDIRTINWKATARTGFLKVNTYTDARQQQIYCLLDKGRNMKMPFEGMTLLDHSINACLALSNVVLLKQDRAGLITFSGKISDIIAADRRADQMHRIMESLYHQQTQFKESDYEALWTTIHRGVTQRSLLLLFTNFESYSSLERQLPYLRQMARRHLTCVVFFQNTLLREIHQSHPDTLEGIYIKTIADQFDYEKRQIVHELRRHGILSILTTPGELTVDVINKYLELKSRQMV